MKGKKTDRSMILTVVAAVFIVATALVIVCLNRYTGVFTPRLTEKRIAQKLDFSDSEWINKLLELSLPSCKKDFSIYSAFSNFNGKNIVTQIYATRAGLDDIRVHYKGLLQNPVLPDKNDVGVLEISGEKNGRKVTIMNYFSEVSNIIQVEMEMSGEYAELIWHKLKNAFPSQALLAVPEIAAFADGESTEAYVMYSHDTFASDVYANIPLFSRAYSFNGTREELEERINTLNKYFNKSAVISDGIAEVLYADWLYQVKALESFSGVKVALIVQEIPKNQNGYF